MDGMIVIWPHKFVWTCQNHSSVFVNQDTMTQDTQGKNESQDTQEHWGFFTFEIANTVTLLSYFRIQLIQTILPLPKTVIVPSVDRPQYYS